MEKYLQHLLQDLESAKSIIPPKPDYKSLYPDHPAFEFGLDHIVEWEMAPSIPMEELFNIKANRFPATDLLTDKQMEQINEAIIDLWQSHRIDVCIPENIPQKIIYKVLKLEWQKPISYVSEGFMGLEFCNYEPSECPFGIDYCTCKDIPTDDFDNFIPIDWNLN